MVERDIFRLGVSLRPEIHHDRLPTVQAIQPLAATGVSLELRDPWRFDLRHSADPELLIRVVVRFAEGTESSRVFVEPATLSPTFHSNQPNLRLRAACLARPDRVEIVWTLSVALGSRLV